MYAFHDNSNIEYLFRGAQIRCFKDPPGENVFADCTVLCFFIVFFFLNLTKQYVVCKSV